MTEAIDLRTLSGAQVKALIKANKITAKRLNELCDFPNSRSDSRINNILNKESWKDGDRERVALALEQLLPTDYRVPEELTVHEITDARIFALNLHDEPDPDLAEVHRADTEAVIGGYRQLEITTVEEFDDLWDAGEPVDVITGPVPEPAAVDLGLPRFTSNAYHLSNSEVQSFKRCKRRWWLAWYLRLTLAEEDRLNLRGTGKRVHRALEAFYVPDHLTPEDPRAALERVLTEDWTVIHAAATARGHDDFVLADLGDRFSKVADLERAMVEGYVEWVEETGADSTFRVTEAEAGLDVPLTDGVNLIGKLDARATRVSDGVRLFLDHKTVGSFKDSVKTLPMNEQMKHYHLLEFLGTEAGEARCDGALYNMLRRVKRTATAKPPFFDRVEVRHNEHELEAYRRELIAVADDIQRTIERLTDDPRTVLPATRTGNCSWDCDFFAVCTMFDDGSRVGDAVRGLYVQGDPLERYERKGNE